MIASLAAVLLLGVMIKINFDDPSWPHNETSEATITAGKGSALSPHPPALTCEETEISLRERIETTRYCETDGDCTLFDFGYPIDCMTSVAKSGITALRLQYRDYEQSCAFRVYYDCPTEPMERRAACQENRCTVSLHTIDTLENETLDYLGIGSSTRSR
jgi:hypothetical protein